MKGNRSLRDCGTVLKKNAKGDEYTWGLRFFKLLTECFKAWSIMDEKGDIAKSYDELRAGGVPMIEQVVYYEFDASQLPTQHQVLDKLIAEDNNNGNTAAPGKIDDNRYNSGSQILYNSNNLGNPTMMLNSKPLNNNILGELNKPDYGKKVDKNYPLVDELEEIKQAYLDALFAEKGDPSRVMEAQICFQSYFDSQREELNKALFGEIYGVMDDKKTDQLLRDIEFGTRLCELIDKESPKYSKKGDIEKMQRKVYEILKVAYTDSFPMYKRIIDSTGMSAGIINDAKPKQDLYDAIPDKKKPVEEKRPLYADYEYDEPKISKFDKQPERQKSKDIDKRGKQVNNYNDVDYRYDGLDEDNDDMYNYGDDDLNIEEGKEITIKADDQKLHEEENRKLQQKREALKKEIEDLRRKERALKTVTEKTESFRGDADPKLLIEEIHKKNQEYEALRSKYMNLMQQMNEKVHMDYGNTKNDKEYLQRSIMDSVNMINDHKNRNRNEVNSQMFRMPTSESYYMPKSMYKSNLNNKYL